ncbi:MAG: hypothetical protein DRJ56_07915 [Thermoprotei archaeon]|nr:MAG: hypothetical protein DRJ56_07915 [Thermoprotei archaeon]
MPEVIAVPEVVADRIRERARALGVAPEVYLMDLVTEGLDPESRAEEYAAAAEEILRQAGSELERGNVRQAAEKLWGACALAVKAYAYWREGRRLVSHGELREYKDRMAAELGDWVVVAFQQASDMHTCFYEGWCTRTDVEIALKASERLVRAVASRVLGRG